MALGYGLDDANSAIGGDPFGKRNKSVIEINKYLDKGLVGEIRTRIRDNRTKRIDVVRKTESVPIDLEFN